MEKQVGKSPEEGRYEADDEIDLFELWNSLLEEKKTVLISFVGVMAVAVIYVFIAKPVYQSTAYLMPPLSADVQPLNRLNEQLGIGRSYAVQELFKDYLDITNSRGALIAFFKENNLAQVYDSDINDLSGVEYEKAFNEAFQAFVDGFSVHIPKKQNSREQVSVSMGLALDNVEVQALLKQFLAEAELKSKQDQLRDFNVVKASYVERLEGQIQAARQIAKDERMDRIAELQEAIDIATDLNIEDPKFTSDSKEAILYFQGYKMLQAEQKVLKNRVSDDPFIEKLRGLQEKLSIAKSMTLTPQSFQVVKVDQAPSLGKRIKPNTLLVLAVAGVLGMMLGVFIALVRRAVKHRSNRNVNKLI